MVSYSLSNLICALAPSFGAVRRRSRAGRPHARRLLLGLHRLRIPARSRRRRGPGARPGVRRPVCRAHPRLAARDRARRRGRLADGLRRARAADARDVRSARGDPALRRPSRGASAGDGGAEVAGAMRSTVIAANALAYLGQFTLYTYVTVILLRSGASQAAVAPLLFLFGVFGLVGHLAGRAAAGPRSAPRRAADPDRRRARRPRPRRQHPVARARRSSRASSGTPPSGRRTRCFRARRSGPAPSRPSSPARGST